VLENSQLWPRWSPKWAGIYPDVALDHMLVDNCAMQLSSIPSASISCSPKTCRRYLSDEGAVIAALRHAASASIATGAPAAPVGLYGR